MAELSISDMIVKLETRIATLEGKIEKQEAFRELEEGGQGARFRTQFSNITELNDLLEKLRTRLRTLRMGENL